MTLLQVEYEAIVLDEVFPQILPHVTLLLLVQIINHVLQLGALGWPC